MSIPFESKPAYVTLLGNVCRILLWSLASWSVNRTLKVSMGSLGSTCIMDRELATPVNVSPHTDMLKLCLGS